MERWVGRVALVTGASVGIGASISKLLVKSGMIVYGCGRNFDNIVKLQSEVEGPGKFHPIKCDVGIESEILNMMTSIRNEHKGVDVLVNNAGLAHFTTRPIIEGDTQQWQEMLNVNVLGVCILTRECVKSMRERKVDDGQVINISSMSGHRTTPGPSHFYSATKYAVKALTEGMRNELREINSNIRVCQISPGIVKTEFWERASNGKMSIEKMPSLEPNDIADSVRYILSAPPHVQVHDILIRPTAQRS